MTKLLLALVFFLNLSGVVACGPVESMVDGESHATIESNLKPQLDYYFLRAPNSGKLSELKALKFGDALDGEQGKCTKREKWVKGKWLWTERTIVVVKVPGFPMTWKAGVQKLLAECLHNIPESTGDLDLMNPHRGGDDAFWKANLEPQLIGVFGE